MACRVRCEAAPIVAGGTSCIEVTGTGITGNPLQVSEVVAPTVQHPLLAIPLSNGLSCGPNGLEVQPDRQFGFGAADQPVGTIPVITTDQAGGGPGGGVPWGPRMDVQWVYLDQVGRPVIFVQWFELPPLHIVLEPGATMTLGIELYSTPNVNDPPAALAPWFAIFTWHFENNGIGVIRYDTPLIEDTSPGVSFAPPNVFGDFRWTGFQLYIATSGFTGASSVSSGLFGSGMVIQGLGLPA